MYQRLTLFDKLILQKSISMRNDNNKYNKDINNYYIQIFLRAAIHKDAGCEL